MTHLCWYGGRGGSGGYISYLKGLLGSGAIPADCTVSLLCSQELASDLGPLDPQVRVMAIPALSNRLRAKWWQRTKFRRVVQELQPHVLFFASGSLVPPPAEIPTVASCHSLLFFEEAEYRKYRYSWTWVRYLRPMRKLHYSLYPKLAGVIFFSPYSRDLVTRHLPNLRHHATIAHGVETDFLAETPVPTIARHPRRILYVSPIHRYKHQGNVVEAVRRLRKSSGVDYQLWLAGGGEPVAVRTLGRRLKTERAREFVHVLGHVARRDLPRLYRDADLFVFASACESFGITLLEAMGSGLPIACSDRTGLPNLLRDAGEYFDPEDPADIAAAIERLSADATTRRHCAERAMRYAREYTWRRCAEQTFAFLRGAGSWA